MDRSSRSAAGAKRGGALPLALFALILIAWVGERTFELDPIMYSSMWRSSFVFLSPMFDPLPGISLTPWQLSLGLLLLVSLKGLQHAREMDKAIFVALICVAVTTLWGLARGGSAYFAYFQLWRFLAALAVAYIFMSVVRDQRDLVWLGRIIVFAAIVRATLCIYFFKTFLEGKVDPLPQYVTNHDDSIIFSTATVTLLSWAFVNGRRSTWLWALLIIGYLGYAMVLNDRRLVWVQIVMGLPLVYLIVGQGPLRAQMNRVALWMSPVVVAYVVGGMASSSPVFAPVHSILSVGSNYDPSSLTRQEEVRNLLHTLVVSGNPLFGTGWGVPYDIIERYWSNYAAEWVLVPYTPHNSLLGLAAFSGLVGVIGIWGVVPLAAFLAARGYRKSTDTVPRAAAMVCVAALAAYCVHTYGDIGFMSLPAVMVLGIAMGTAGKVLVWAESASKSRVHEREIIDVAPSKVGGRRRRSPRATATPRKSGAEHGRRLPQ